MILFERVVRLLKNANVWYELLEHEPVYTSEQAAAVRGDVSLHQRAKAMVLRVWGSKLMADRGNIGDNNTINNEQITNHYIMGVLPGDKKIDFKKLKKTLKVRDCTLASPEEVERLVGVKVGAVSPLGNLSGLAVWLDASMMNNEKIIFSAGDHSKSVKMKLADYIRISGAKISDFSK